jgi:hypothetical protein
LDPVSESVTCRAYAAPPITVPAAPIVMAPPVTIDKNDRRLTLPFLIMSLPPRETSFEDSNDRFRIVAGQIQAVG